MLQSGNFLIKLNQWYYENKSLFIWTSFKIFNLKIIPKILLEILLIIIWIENRKVFTCDPNYLASHPNWLRSISCSKSYTAVCFLFILYYLWNMNAFESCFAALCRWRETTWSRCTSAQRNIQRHLNSWEWWIDVVEWPSHLEWMKIPNHETHHDCLSVPLYNNVHVSLVITMFA